MKTTALAAMALLFGGCYGTGEISNAGAGAGGSAAGGSGAGSGGGGQGGIGGAGGLPGADGGLPQGGGGGSGGASGLPCDVQAVLEAHCQSCHSSPPVGGAPMALVSYADLTRPSLSDPSRSVAALCVARVQDLARPMPPPPATPPSAAEIATLAAWVSAGLPMGSCATPDGGVVDGGGDPYNTPPMCSSGQFWTGGNNGSSVMRPGRACIDCHRSSGGEAPLFTFAGTAYPTAHEPNDCNGAGGAQIVIVDANNQTFTLSTNGAGNFSIGGGGSSLPVAFPYHAKIVKNGRERVMSAGQTTGDCNSCHTETGANGAPGRIMLP